MSVHRRTRTLLHAYTYAEAGETYADDSAAAAIKDYGQGYAISDEVDESISAAEAVPAAQSAAEDGVGLADTQYGYGAGFIEGFRLSDNFQGQTGNGDHLLFGDEGIFPANNLSFTDGFGLADSFQLRVNRIEAGDSFGLADGFQLRVNRIEAGDSFGLADGFQLRVNRIDLQDSLGIADSMAVSSGAVISDLAVKPGGMTFEDFMTRIDHPAGYGKFQMFHVGEYEYQEAIVRVTMKTPVLGTIPQIYDMVMNVDIDDTVDRGLSTLTAGDNKVSFHKHYYTRPEVTAVIRSGVAAGGTVSAVVSDIDTAGFHVKLVKSDGNLAAGSVSWTAVGY